MRILLCAALLLGLGCNTPKTHYFSRARIPPQASIAVQVLGPDPSGLEHALSVALWEAGFVLHSSAAMAPLLPPGHPMAQALDQETLRRYGTQYICLAKAKANDLYVATYTIQLIQVETGRPVLSLQSDLPEDRRPDQVVQIFREALAPIRPH